MNLQELERRITAFQAQSRGFLVRKELCLIRLDYEDIVREIEGDLSGLVWRGSLIPTPHFTALTSAGAEAVCRTAGCEQASRHYLTKWHRDLEGQLSEDKAPIPERDQGPAVPSQLSSKAEEHQASERNISRCLGRPRLGSDSHSGDEALVGGVSESAAETTSVWESMAMDCSSSLLQKVTGVKERSQFQAMPRTQEELRLERSSLTMELLWLQQAIGSRKKYLTLKQGLGTLER